MNRGNQGIASIRGNPGAEAENKLSSVAIDLPDRANPVRDALGSAFQPLSRQRNTIKNRTSSPDFSRDLITVESYCKGIKSYRSLTLREERMLGLEIQKGGKEALQALVRANLKFVVAVCRNYLGRGLPFADLVNEGNLGLIRAARRFDGSMNFKFISYAVWWIRQGILTALAEQTRPLNIPVGRIESVRAIRRASRRLEQDLHRAPSTEELAERTGKSAEAITACGQVSAPSVSLDTAPGDGGEGLRDSLEDRNGDATDLAALRHLLNKKVNGMLDALGARERTVIALYYGIGRDTGYSLSEIGLRLDLTRERIRQIRNKALIRLKRSARRITVP